MKLQETSTLYRVVNDVLIKSHRPLYVHEINESIQKLGGRPANLISSEDIDQALNSKSSPFGKIGLRYFSVDHPYYSKFIPRFEYLRNTLKSTLGSQSNAFIPFLFFIGRMPAVLDGGVNYQSVYFLENMDGRLAKELIGSVISNCKRQFPELSEFFSQQEIVLFQVLSRYNEGKLFNDLFQVLHEFELATLDSENFSLIFEFVIASVLTDERGFFALSDPLMSQIINLFIEPREDVSVLDPYLGIGTFITKAAQKLEGWGASFEGVELNKEILELASLNFIVNGLSPHCLTLGDFTQQRSSQKFDFVITELPVSSMPNQMRYTKEEVTKPSSLSIYLTKVIEALEDSGIALVVLGDQYLDSNRDVFQELRKHLVDFGQLEAVFRFNSTDNRTRRPWNLLVIKKQLSKSLKEVELYDFTRLHRQPGPSDFDSFFDRNIDSDYLLKVPIEIIRRNDFNLNPANYTQNSLEAEKLISNQEGRYLGDLVSITRGYWKSSSVSKEELEEIPVVLASRLESSVEASIIHSDLLDYSKSIKNRDKLEILDKEGIILNRHGKELKPMLFVPKPEIPRVLIGQHNYILLNKRGRTEISLKYIYYQLYTSVVRNQIEKNLRKNVSLMVTLTTQNLSKIVIPFISLEEQLEFVQGKSRIDDSNNDYVVPQDETIDFTEEEKKGQTFLEKEIAATEDEIIRTLVHQLRGKLQTINNTVKSLRGVITKKELGEHRFFSEEEINIARSNPENLSVNEYLDLLKSDTTHLQTELTFLRKLMHFELDHENLKKLDILAFIKDWSKASRSIYPDNIRISVIGESVEVELEGDVMKALFEQVLKNTFNHGVSERKPSVELKIEVKQQMDSVSIDISNNGETSKMKIDDFTKLFHKRNKSKGSGIGGNYIYRIVRAHQGRILPLEVEEGFGFSIELPKTQQL